MIQHKLKYEGPAGEMLPTMYDLPSENPEDPGLDQFHSLQAKLLADTFVPPDYGSDRMMVARSLFLYYDVHRPLSYKCPLWQQSSGNWGLIRGV